ncbi:MAG: hypothetical protein JWM27_2199 [Gemmatimonadetes bacterium]|nr:hypothetical protein [Gemmatimonadota bacterium]
MRALSILRLLCPAAALLAAGCGAAGATDARTLTPAEVAGDYRLCALRFTPSQGGLPAVDLLARVIDPAPPAGKPDPVLHLSGTAPRFDLAYTRRADGFAQRAEGGVEFGGSSVFLYLTSDVPTSIQTESLLPQGHLDLVFHPATRRLTAGDEVSVYWVRRSDYTAASGFPAEALQDRIYGHVTASFDAGACPAG